MFVGIVVCACGGHALGFQILIFEIFQVLFLFLFFGCDTATQLARQLYQERTQVLLCFISGVRRKEAEL